MSQNRQAARQAKQDQRRQTQRDMRRRRRRLLLVVSDNHEQHAVDRPTLAGRWTWKRIALILLVGTVIILGAVRLALWFLVQQITPLPGGGIPSNGNQHVAPGTAHGAYFTNPPTSGWHFDELPRPGVYTNARLPEGLGHFMEHGGVWVLYSCPDTCDDLARQLTDLVIEQTDRNRPVAVAPYPPPGYQRPLQRINVVAWQHLLSLDEFDREAITEFVERLACNYTPEGGPYCTWRKGTSTGPVDAGQGGFSSAPRGPTPAAGVPGATATAPVLGPTAAATPAPAR